MIYNRAQKDVRPLFELGFGKRPQEELYDLRSDPDYLSNVAYEPGYTEIREDLNDQLMNLLIKQEDPRVVESPPRFEKAPYAGSVSEEWQAENTKQLWDYDPGSVPKTTK